MSPDPDAYFDGHPDRVCGEHRTTGRRAWCFACSGWCYSNIPCRGCELPALRSSFAEAVRLLRQTNPWDAATTSPSKEELDAFLASPAAQDVP